MIEIIWEQTGDDPEDIKAVVPEGMLRVERMDKKTYWWCVYFNNDTYDVWMSKISRPKTMEEAKQQVEDKYKSLL